MSTSARVLIPLTYGFSVRYLVPTGLLVGLAEVAQPVVGLGWDDPDLRRLLHSLGVETVVLPVAELTHDYRMYRRRIALVHERRLRSPTTGIRRRRRLAMMSSTRDRWLSRLREARDALVVSLPGAAASLEAQEPAQVRAGTNALAFEEMLAAAAIDAVLSVTPYHDQDGLVLWAAQRRGIPSLTSVISFDNPTTRERMLAVSERIAVWNSYNASELLRSYPGLDAGRIDITGAPQFDLHRRPELVMDRADWCHALDLPTDRPIILYGAGPTHLVPGEPALVMLLDDAVEAGRLPGDPYLLVRRHPTDPPEPWQELDRSLRHGRVVDPWAAGTSAFTGWPTQEETRLQMSSLAHSDVHVNVCSSMTLDGAMFDRPQIGPTFVPGATARENRRIADMYRQEHWQPIGASGGIVTAGDEQELLRSVGQAIEHPDRGRDERRLMIRDLLTFDDGRSSERLVEAVGRMLAS